MGIARLRVASCTARPFVLFNGMNVAPPLLKIQVVCELAPELRARVASLLVNELGISVSSEQPRQELGFKEPANEGDAVRGYGSSAAGV